MGDVRDERRVMSTAETDQSNREGIILYLNGTSSSGKTTLARELHHILHGPWLNVQGDTFFAELSHPEPWAVQPIVSAIHAFVVTVGRGGVGVIVDGLLVTRTWLKDAVDQLAEHQAYLVAVRCPLPEVERREAARSDRRLGNAREQYDLVHAHGIYDFEVDTSQEDATASARRIAEWLSRATEPVAFRLLRDSPYLNDENAYGWVLVRGSTGSAVRRLQEDLRALGHDPGPVDGMFGVQTEAAVRAFQKAHDLPLDGAIGWPRTVKAILHALKRSGSTAE